MPRPSQAFSLEERIKKSHFHPFIKRPVSLRSMAVIAVILLSLSSCSSSRLYVVLDSKSYPPATKPVQKYILLDPAHFAQPVDLARLVKVLNTGSFKFRTRDFNLTREELPFLYAVDHILKGDYESAQKMLFVLPEKAFDWQVKVLKMDCASHLGRAVDGRKEYQVAYDSASSSAVKDLAKTRYRFYQYGK